MPLIFPDDPLLLDSFLPYRLAVLSHRVSRGLAHRYEARFGISIPEWRCLAILARSADLTAGELAERTSLDRVQVSRATGRLVDRGIVARRADSGDRRAVRLTLTDAGKQLFAEIADVARAWEQDLTRALGISDRRALDRVMAKLERALDQMDAEERSS
jgi:DNA-binding MarR family transcriptional regulator